MKKSNLIKTFVVTSVMSASPLACAQLRIILLYLEVGLHTQTLIGEALRATQNRKCFNVRVY